MGQSDTETEKIGEKIDWIAYSQKNAVDWVFPSFIDDKWKDISPLQNYTNGQENSQGVKRFWNVKTATQGRLTVYGGNCLTSIGANVDELLQFISLHPFKPTRIDFVVDITHRSPFNPKSVIQHLRNKDVVTHAKSIPRYEDEWESGFTQYIGKKSSETYTRIYDKSVEENAPYKWSRIETVYQGKRARPALQAYLLHKSTKPLILSHVDFPSWKQWRRVMQARKASLRYQIKQSNTRKWLLDSVSSTIAKELLLDDDQAFLFELMDRVRIEYKRLSKNEDIDW